MKRTTLTFLSAAFLLGLSSPVTSVFAKDDDLPKHFHNLPPEERRQMIDRIRQERAREAAALNRPNVQGAPQRREERASPPLAARQTDPRRDGGVSREEAGKMPRLSRHFDEIDTNRDGIVSRDEMRIFREKRLQQRTGGNDGDPRF